MTDKDDVNRVKTEKRRGDRQTPADGIDALRKKWQRRPVSSASELEVWVDDYLDYLRLERT